MGQLLSLIMLAAGVVVLALVFVSGRKPSDAPEGLG
jgi:hypothetical protein